MSLTKRLYRLDEVRSAFIFSIKSKRLYEACFWLKELEETKEGEARRVLFLTWFLVYGLSNCSWIFAWATNSETAEGRLKLCWQLCRCSERDTSLWWIFCAGAVYTDPKEQLSIVFDKWRSSYHLDHEDFWQPLVDVSTIEPIDLCLHALQIDMDKYILYARLAGLALITIQTRIPKSSLTPLSQEEPIDLLKYLTEWAEAKSLRDARAFPIPQGCLYGITWRGCGGDTTQELRSLTLKSFLRSPVWKQTLIAYTTGSTWTSDEDLEAFYDTEFYRCDIPDEWSAEDQQKSHGIYPLVAGKAPLWKWWVSWIGELPHKWVWGTIIDQVLVWTKEIDLNATGAILEYMNEVYKKKETVGMLEPKKKEWVLSIPPLSQK